MLFFRKKKNSMLKPEVVPISEEVMNRSAVEAFISPIPIPKLGTSYKKAKPAKPIKKTE